MATQEIHVGDVGTLYRVRCMDNGVDFDPSTADVEKSLTFKMGGLLDGGNPVETLERNASVEDGEGEEDGQFFLTYIVTASDVTISGFHSTSGAVKVQAYVEWSDGRKFHSDIQTTDTDGNELKVYSNL